MQLVNTNNRLYESLLITNSFLKMGWLYTRWMKVTKVKEDISVHKEMFDKGLAITDKEIRDIIKDLIKRNLVNKEWIENENK